MMNLRKKLAGPEDTAALAQSMAPYVLAGDVILLKGTLGAGKSYFARHFIKAMGTEQSEIPSPTFTLIQAYDDTRLPVAHVDLYRLNSPEEIEALGLDVYFDHGVSLIEWPEKGEGYLPENTLVIEIEETEDGGRVATLSGKSWESRFGFFEPSLCRQVSETGRRSFLTLNDIQFGDITAVSDDASFRSYWRTQTAEGNRVIMDAPPPMENVNPFVNVASFLKEQGIHVPEIYAKDTEEGYLLLEDLGNTTVAKAFEKGADKKDWYNLAVDVLVHLAKQPTADVPKYDVATYWRELSLFTDWYLPDVTGRATDPSLRQKFHDIWLPLYEKMDAVPKTTVLRDYHIRNMMALTDTPITHQESLGIIDFQDALVGPVTYDMASMLQDAYITLPDDLKNHLIRRFVDGMDGAVTMQDFMTSFRLIGLQRALKIVGIFTRLARRDGKTAYLNDMHRVWRNIDEALEHPDCAQIKAFMDQIMPQDRELIA